MPIQVVVPFFLSHLINLSPQPFLQPPRLLPYTLNPESLLTIPVPIQTCSKLIHRPVTASLHLFRSQQQRPLLFLRDAEKGRLGPLSSHDVVR
jgi:hypothetical protein